MIILNGLQCLIFLFCLYFNSLVLADTKAPSTNPIYCQRGECLYRDETGCVVIPTDITDAAATKDNASELSTSQLNDALSQLNDGLTDSHTTAPSPAANRTVAAVNNNIQEKVNKSMSQVEKDLNQYAVQVKKDANTTYQSLKRKNQQMRNERIIKQQPMKKIDPVYQFKKISREYVTKIKKNSNTTYQRLKSKNQQMTNERVIKQQPMKNVEPVYHYKASTNPSTNIVYKNNPAKQKSTKKLNPKATVHAAIDRFYYKPTIDFAQYALHQGNSRSGNLIEGFIPLGEFTFDQVIFLDLRYYNPNGTPFEWNADLAFRQFSRTNFLWGIYGGYDRFRSATRHYYSQINAGFEFWFNKVFLGANAYLPIGKKAYVNTYDDIAGLVSTSLPYRYNIAYEYQNKERILPGGDAELGYDLTHGLTVYAGGYYFDHANAKRIAGPKLRATYTFYRSDQRALLKLFDRIRFEGLISHDSVRGTRWTVGLRLRLGKNPVKGVIRHMTDPIRRDLNVVSENDNNWQPTKFYMIDNHRARVDLVSDTSGRTIDAAVNGDADIIGVVGAQDATGELTVGDRNLTVTGGQYDFTVDGRPYSIARVGYNGQLTSAGSNENLITLADSTGDHAFTLEYIMVNSLDDTGWALQTNGETFGQITVNDVISDMPFDFRLTTSGATGNISFTNNILNLQNSTAIDPSISSFAGIVDYAAAGAGQLTFSAFSDNEINIINRTVDNNECEAMVTENSLATVFTNGFLRNNFTASGTSSSAYGWFLGSSTATIVGNMSGNTFTASGVSPAYGWYLADNSTATISGDMSGNTFTASGPSTAYGWFLGSSSTAMISGDMRGNTFTASETSTAYGWYLALDGTATISGDMSGNTFTASGASTAYGWSLAFGGTATISGDMSGNTFTASGTFSAYGWSIEQSNTAIVGAVNSNDFDISSPTAIGLSIATSPGNTVTFNQAVTNNRFLINGDLMGNVGINLDNSAGGLIAFNETIGETYLKDLNNGATINVVAGSTITWKS